MSKAETLEKATLAGGCFWCMEAIFKRLKGVEEVISGYAEGAEAIQIKFDPKIIAFAKILEVFWHLIDPTTLNRQGADVGEQYRSVIFYHDDEQKRVAQESQKAAQKLYQDPIVTKIEPFKTFFKAEGYHQNYYERNSGAPYCRIVIDPKIQKLMTEFRESVKK